MILALDGREYMQLHITKHAIKLETLDGEGTGRTKAQYWPMTRDPQGSIINLALEIATTSSKNAEFLHLWRTCKSMGEREFVSVKFVDPTGDIISQNMYLVMAELRYKRIEQNGVVFTDAIQLNLVAEKGS